MAAAETYVPPLEIEHSCPSAVVIDANRGRLLYAREHEKKQNIPASSKMMTAWLACERLPLQTQVTISKVAGLADASFVSPDGIHLVSGSKYPLEYLLLRLIYFNSDAAALAIAEQLSGVEERFVELMNSRAKSLNLGGTVYANCTGAVAYLSQPTDNSQGLLPVEQSLRQYTTPLDLARLLAAATQNKLFSQLMSQPSQYVVLDGNTLVAMSNDLWRIWTLSEGRVSGAFSSPLAGRSYLVALGKLDSVPLIVVAAAGQPDRRLQDILALVDACDDYYEVTPLVQAGDIFSGEKERRTVRNSVCFTRRPSNTSTRPVTIS
jgi:D-alanyl-D-alanine carboxypeptidase